MAVWEQLLATVVDDHSAALLTYGRMLTGNQQDAEDLLHDALVKVFSKRSRTFRSRRTADEATSTTAAVAYVRRTMTTIQIDRYRRDTRWNLLRPRIASDDRAGDTTAAVDVTQDVTAALHALTTMQRSCVLLRYYDDLTVPQIADALGASQGTIKRHLHDGLKRLRHTPALTDHGPGRSPKLKEPRP